MTDSMNSNTITILPESPFSQDAISLMDELSDCLQAITGDSGRSSFDAHDVCGDRALFIIARNKEGKAVGCGAFRPIDGKTAECKRMYAKEKGIGLGNKILTYLEEQARGMGYRYLRLETRVINREAVAFYERNGYQRIPNYGKYENRPEAVCFEKQLTC